MPRLLRIIAAILLLQFGGVALAQVVDGSAGNGDAQSPEYIPDDEGPRPDDVTNAETDMSAPVSLANPAPLRVRLSEDLDEDQIAAIMPVIEAMPNVILHDVATHEIAPNPVFPEYIVLSEIKGASADPPKALDAGLRVDGAMSLRDVYDFYDDDFRNKYAWASNVPLPIELGDPMREGFAAELTVHLAGFARRGGLIATARWNSAEDIGVCLSNAISQLDVCPMPENGRGWNHVDAAEPIYLTVSSVAPEPRHFSVAVMDRAGNLTPIPVIRALRNEPDYVPIGEGAPADAPAAQPRGYAVSVSDLNSVLQPGNYELVIVSNPYPINPQVWETNGDPASRPGACDGQFEQKLCEAMRGNLAVLPYDWGGDFTVVPIMIKGEVKPTRRLIRANIAVPEVRPWQAQLLRYVRNGAASSSGSRNTIDFIKSHKCGGAYIGDGFVLTAAHCILDDPAEMRVRLGASHIKHGGTTFKVYSLVEHAKGSSRHGRVDLALIRLAATERQLKAVHNLKAINPATNPDKRYPIIAGLTVTGWGFEKPRRPGETGWEAADGTTQTRPAQLLQLVLRQLDSAKCASVPQFSAYKAVDILCLKGVPRDSDSCAGDSGGPVTSRAGRGRELVGVVSSGVGCAFTGDPAVYAKVARYAKWIERAKTKMRDSPRGYYELGGR